MASDDSRQLAHGQLCYLELPATDTERAADFYRQVFGWNVSGPHFEGPGLTGQWVNAATSAPLLWITVNDIGEALETARKAGGEVITEPTRDGSRLLATIRDAGGYVIGVAQH